MGKWAARLAEKSTAPPYACTDRTAKRGLLSVLAVSPEGGTGEFQAATLQPREATQVPDACELVATAWTDANIARFLDRRARLLQWGWPEADAEAWADRLVRRDREADPRVSCTDCRHYRPGRCSNHRRAGMIGADVGRDLAAMLQCCPGFQPTR